MTRFTQSLNAAWSTVKCPRCGTKVDPAELAKADAEAANAAADNAADPDGKRWSFLWTPPRGDFCPECEFPLSKYFGRIKWIRTLIVGVGIVILAVTVQIVGSVARLGEGFLQTRPVSSYQSVRSHPCILITCRLAPRCSSPLNISASSPIVIP